MITITTGYNADQRHSISDDEAHKAYYLFINPDARTIFSNGIAIRGVDIQNISPDYHGTMGWHSTHRLDSDDMEELRAKGIDKKLAAVLAKAKAIASEAKVNPSLLEMKLSDIESTPISLKMGYIPKTL